MKLPVLAFDVRARVPRIGTMEEGFLVRRLSTFLTPGAIHPRRRFDCRDIVIAQVSNAVSDPVAQAFTTKRHVEQYRGRFRTMDHEQVRKAGDRHAEVSAKALGPSLLQINAVASLRIEAQQRASDRIESGGQYQHIKRVLARFRDNAGRGKSHDRILAQIDQRDVVAVVSFEIAVVDDLPLRAEYVVGHQFGRGVRVFHGCADFTAHEFGQRRVRVFVQQQVVVAVEQHVQAAVLPEFFVQRLALLRRIVQRGFFATADKAYRMVKQPYSRDASTSSRAPRRVRRDRPADCRPGYCTAGFAGKPSGVPLVWR